MGAGAVRITGGQKRYGRHRPVLAGVELTIGAGEFVAVLGRSGSGKSTLLRVIAGLEELTAGSIEWHTDGAATRPQTGVVFQQPSLMPWLTVRQNVSFAGRLAAHRAAFEPGYADELIHRFALAPVADRYPDELSGGQAQRVAVIRAIAVRPRLLLLDEPFSALDPATRADLQGWLGALAAELTITVVLVTHDVDEALLLADRVLLLGTDGRIRGDWQPGADTATDQLRQDILGRYRTVEPS